MNKAIILVSGGLDSLITSAIAHKENDEIYFLHINYGQNTEKKELESFHKISDYYKPKQIQIVNIGYLKNFGGSILLDSKFVSSEHNESDIVPETYVPFRNGNMIAIASAYAETIRATRIYIGAIEAEGSNYPDCRGVFFEYMGKAINYGTKNNFSVKIITPLLNMTKAEIVKLGYELKAPMELSWSCYFDNEIACGQCDSCYLRLKSFKEAGLIDPIPYRK